MPRDLNLDPHPEQAAILKALGFAQEANSPHTSNVLWRGPHGLFMEMDAGEKPTFESAVAAIVHAALQAGAEEVRGMITKALRLRTDS